MKKNRSRHLAHRALASSSFVLIQQAPEKFAVNQQALTMMQVICCAYVHVPDGVQEMPMNYDDGRIVAILGLKRCELPGGRRREGGEHTR